MTSLDSVHEQAAQTVITHAEMPMSMWNINT